MKKILMFVATKGSNLELAQRLEDVFKTKGQQVDMINLEEEDLPLYTTTKHKQGVPKRIAEISKMANEASGFVFVGPEYNGSAPPVMNNIMAWISVSGGKDWRAAFNGKVAMLATSSGGPGARYQSAMTQQLNYIGAIVLPRMVFVFGKKAYDQEEGEAVVDQLLSLI